MRKDPWPGRRSAAVSLLLQTPRIQPTHLEQETIHAARRRRRRRRLHAARRRRVRGGRAAVGGRRRHLCQQHEGRGAQHPAPLGALEVCMLPQALLHPFLGDAASRVRRNEALSNLPGPGRGTTQGERVSREIRRQAGSAGGRAAQAGRPPAHSAVATTGYPQPRAAGHPKGTPRLTASAPCPSAASAPPAPAAAGLAAGRWAAQIGAARGQTAWPTRRRQRLQGRQRPGGPWSGGRNPHWAC